MYAGLQLLNDIVRISPEGLPNLDTTAAVDHTVGVEAVSYQLLFGRLGQSCIGHLQLSATYTNCLNQYDQYNEYIRPES